MLELQMTNEQMIHIAVTPTTLTGQPAQLDGPISVSIVGGNGGVRLDDDGRGAYLISADEPSDVTYLIEADADLGSGVQTIQDTVLVHVSGALAANLGLTAGAPEPKSGF